MQSDGTVVEVDVAAPVRGLLEGIDPATETFDESYSPLLENVRINAALWQTRLGISLWSTLPGAGAVRLLDNLYQASGAIARLAAQGTGSAAQLYELKVGTDTGFVSASGGAGLGGTTYNLFQGCTLADRYYLTDRSAALFRYTPGTLSGNHLQAVTQPAAPVAAPTARARPYGKLEDWTSPLWTDSNAAQFAHSDDTSANPPPDGGKTEKLAIAGTGAMGATISDNTLFLTVPAASHTIAFYTKQDTLNVQVGYQFGSVSRTDFTSLISGPQVQAANTWSPFFVPIGTLPEVPYNQFACTQVVSGKSGNVWVSALYLPGYLDGPYRWLYTYYDPVGFRESAPSPITNGGGALDFSAVGTSFDNSTTAALQKTCALAFTASSDPSATQIRIYRSGGVPELTVDENGNDLWLQVATITPYSTTFSATDAAGSTILDLTAHTGIHVGDWLVLDQGVTGAEEYVQVTALHPTSVTITNGLGAGGGTLFSHAIATGTAAIAYVDNTANELIQLTQTVDIERNDPEAGALFVQRSPEGRLWLFGPGTTVSISNKPTPLRPYDFEVFPRGVDPTTRRSLTQGFQVQITGSVAQDEAIVWGGFYRGHPMFLTRRGCYIVRHQAQIDWSPTSIQLVHRTGCIAGDTVVEVQGKLYWVAEGPRIMEWDGQSEPVVISDRTCNVRLNAAPSAYWSQWFAVAHTSGDGPYYRLYFTPAGQTTNTERLDYNLNRQAFEPTVYYDSNANPIGYAAAAVRSGAETADLYQAATNGLIDQAETGNLDRGSPIRITFSSHRILMRRVHPYWSAWQEVSLVHNVLMRQAAANDTVNLQVSTGGSEYEDITFNYPVSLAGTGDVEVKTRTDRSLYGRWVQLTISGPVYNRPSFRAINILYLPIRPIRLRP